jgi:hypothetical protein
MGIHTDPVGWGLGGYEVWIGALESGTIGSDGGGEMAKMVRECRGHARSFLDEIKDHFDSSAQVHAHLHRARDLYQIVVDAWDAYLKVFPGVSSESAPGDVENPQDRHRALLALRRAYETEQKAIAEIEAALGAMERGNGERSPG